MELIDRYVAEVGRHLPHKQRTDIEAELRSSLVDNLEARTSEQPSQKDVINLLQEYGPPKKMAASYWPEGQYLIGPSLYPLFRMVVGIALLVVVIVQLVLLGVALLFRPDSLPVRGFVDDFVPTIVSVFGWIVIAFALMQRFGMHPQIEADEWDPSDLPPVEDAEPFSPAGTVIEIIIGLVLVMLLYMLPEQLPALFPPRVQLFISPILLRYLPLLLISILLGIGLNVVLLWRGKWEIGTRLTKIALNLFGISILALLINSHTSWLAAHNASGFFSSLESITQDGQIDTTAARILSMQVYRLVFIVALLATSVDTLRVGWRFVRGLIDRSGAPTHISSDYPPTG